MNSKARRRARRAPAKTPFRPSNAIIDAMNELWEKVDQAPPSGPVYVAKRRIYETFSQSPSLSSAPTYHWAPGPPSRVVISGLERAVLT